MTDKTIDFKALAAPFGHRDIAWRFQSAWVIGGDPKKPCARVLAYITNRAIQQRLDEICTPANWQNLFPGGDNSRAFICGISIRIDNEWITKYDGSDTTIKEPVKGGLSGAMKRAAVQWGMGRYLYRLKGGWAKFHPDAFMKAK